MFNHLLTVFVCAADCGSFNKAAEKLYLSAPSVMKQVNALEKQLDMKLFHRTNQGLHLTPAGQVIYRHAKYLFSYSRNAIAEARAAASLSEKTFCIGSSLLNPCKPFMDLWYKVNASFPGYRLHIVPFEDDHQGILTEISSLGKKFDFLIGVCDSALWLDRCNFLPLGTYQHCISMSREHRLASKKRLRIEDLYGETLMMVKQGDSDTVDAIRAEILKHPQIHIADAPQFYDIEVFNQCEQSQNLIQVIRASFNQRRKTLANGLANYGAFGLPKEELQACIEELGVPVNIRGEALSLEQFAQLSNIIYDHRSAV